MFQGFFNIWWRRRGSNSLPLECHSSALPSELRPRVVSPIFHRRKLLYHRIFVLSIGFVQIFKNFSVNEFAHNDETLVRAETLVIAGAGGEGYELVAAGDAHAEVEKAHIHSGLGDGNNVNVVAVDIEAEVLGEGDGENFKCVDAAVGGEIDVLVFGDEVLIGERHKGLELAAGFLEGHEAVVPVVTVDYCVLGELAAAKVRGFCRPGYAAGLVI